jgi:hypothetical protein
MSVPGRLSMAEKMRLQEASVTANSRLLAATGKVDEGHRAMAAGAKKQMGFRTGGAPGGDPAGAKKQMGFRTGGAPGGDPAGAKKQKAEQKARAEQEAEDRALADLEAREEAADGFLQEEARRRDLEQHTRLDDAARACQLSDERTVRTRSRSHSVRHAVSR